MLQQLLTLQTDDQHRGLIDRELRTLEEARDAGAARGRGELDRCLSPNAFAQRARKRRGDLDAALLLPQNVVCGQIGFDQ